MLRDDLGRFNDLTDLNYEVMYSRGIAPGEWIVNVQAYRIDRERRPPIPVKVVVSVKKPEDMRPVQILEKMVQLDFVWHELTVFRFVLTGKGDLVYGSINDLQTSLVREQAEANQRELGG